eukprot:766901-Rhodomonas_salina.1
MRASCNCSDPATPTSVSAQLESAKRPHCQGSSAPCESRCSWLDSRNAQHNTQDKTRRDKTRRDETRQDKTRQDKTRQDKTRQDRTGQDSAVAKESER